MTFNIAGITCKLVFSLIVSYFVKVVGWGGLEKGEEIIVPAVCSYHYQYTAENSTTMQTNSTWGGSIYANILMN